MKTTTKKKLTTSTITKQSSKKKMGKTNKSAPERFFAPFESVKLNNSRI